MGNTTGSNNILVDTGYYVGNDNLFGNTNQIIPESGDGKIHLTSALSTDTADVNIGPDGINLTTEEANVFVGTSLSGSGLIIDIYSGNTLVLNGITSGSSTTYLTIDPITNEVTTSSGATGSSGTSGTSGTAGEPGASGSSGTSGINGTSGTSGGGGGGGSTTITGVTLTQTGWTYNTGSTYYEYTYTNTGITSSVAVLFTPYNSSVFTSVSANVYPYIELNYTTNTAKLTADSYPSGDITGQFIIF